MRLVSPSSLTGAEKLVFDNLKAWLPPQGVCVNVMLGHDPWDIRPLLLVNNKVSLYRFSRPLGQKALSALAAEPLALSPLLREGAPRALKHLCRSQALQAHADAVVALGRLARADRLPRRPRHRRAWSPICRRAPHRFAKSRGRGACPELEVGNAYVGWGRKGGWRWVVGSR
jgi:hypothetical protein